MDKSGALKKYFGYDSFREGQEELIGHILDGTDTLGIMPTGAGKSICYQLPALLFDGITLVISPLISLMKDQVNSLNQAGISAAYLNSSLNNAQYAKALQNAAAGKYKIVYVAPERLQSPDFLRFAQNSEISMITIDEAHCVSQWGQDFRPSYLKIARFVEAHAVRPVVSAFTATATSKVRDDIIEKLELRTPHVLTTGFDRKNLHFSVLKPADKLAELKRYLSGKEDRFGIVYCSTRKAVEEVCGELISAGFRAARYHAGLSDQERKENQELFLYDQCNVMVATNAFGMGIDKSNVSYVVHYNMPKNMESYYQEAGRAGRDGEPAECLLFYSGQDVVTNQFLIENASENEELDEAAKEAVREKDRQLLKKMTFYCHTNDCLREYILNYFGERAPNYCGSCSNCNSNFEDVDVTAEAQKILSCIKRSGERYGLKMIVDILRGSKNQKLLSNKLHLLPTYGVLADCPESKLRDILNFLVLQDFITITNTEYPVVRLKESAAKILSEDCKVKMKILKLYDEEAEGTGRGQSRMSKTAKALKTKTAAAKSSKTGRTARTADAGAEVEADEELFGRLKALRSSIAADQRVPAYIVFSDATLWDMCRRLPANTAELLDVNGVGLAKSERYGERFINEIKAYAQQRG
jgi:ATP-dependent DNA helicase RecQ